MGGMGLGPLWQRLVPVVMPAVTLLVSARLVPLAILAGPVVRVRHRSRTAARSALSHVHRHGRRRRTSVTAVDIRADRHTVRVTECKVGSVAVPTVDQDLADVARRVHGGSFYVRAFHNAQVAPAGTGSLRELAQRQTRS